MPIDPASGQLSCRLRLARRQMFNDVIRLALREGQEDLQVFEDRVAKPVIPCKALHKDPKAHGQL
ncbi:MAG TPA: hypothetical protein PK001_02115 [Dokdonella sp.]|uniref:hypothetical protein n=1 Tax=Dokdonella sp. TaxID=2291710 RepID=UPI002BD24BE9|nr:hypothetical protein [Dokdonella sp.]HOX70513.1 hypothetical protein [Dokdonella sp.]